MEDKLRIVTDFDKLSQEIQEQLKLVYPNGFSQHLISFTNKEGKRVSALRFETDEKVYLIRMSFQKAEQIISDDDDYNDDGFLKKHAKEDYKEKYSDQDYLMPNDDDSYLDQE